MAPLHTITQQPWRSTSVGELLALEMTTLMLWPLNDDDRMTVLINLMAAQIDRMVEDDNQIDALIDLLRLQLKMKSGGVMSEESPRKLSRNDRQRLYGGDG
jgi:hypothetical protein